MAQIHHANNKLSPIKNDVFGSIPWKKAVATATAIPPSTHMAWHMHALVQGISSRSVSTLRPNNTHGQKSPFKPATKTLILNMFDNGTRRSTEKYYSDRYFCLVLMLNCIVLNTINLSVTTFKRSKGKQREKIQHSQYYIGKLYRVG